MRHPSRVPPVELSPSRAPRPLNYVRTSYVRTTIGVSPVDGKWSPPAIRERSEKDPETWCALRGGPRAGDEQATGTGAAGPCSPAPLTCDAEVVTQAEFQFFGTRLGSELLELGQECLDPWPGQGAQELRVGRSQVGIGRERRPVDLSLGGCQRRLVE